MNQNRAVIIGVAAVVVLALAYGAYLFFGPSGEAGPGRMANSAFEQELLVAGPLGDMSLGDPDAPVTVIDYASLTCSHCADFEINTLPQLKEKYIETGKVHYILRDFPFDPIATAAFMLAHCAGPERYFGFVGVLFRQQTQWAFTQTPMEDLKALARQGGISEERFDACMKDQKIFDHVKEVALRGAKTFGVRSTPTFFINGEKVEGALPWRDFEPLIEKALAGQRISDTPASGTSTPAAPAEE
ncbi:MULTISPECIES: DsbA family protein [Alphaproteobacteria]|uniref:DsbA family protein n=1 Tax=Alphaproteobacteria TaxID=28211 RepID=UPI0027210D80|nr:MULTISPECIES: DsbA family protein [Alphaproteobacteria]MDO9127944.1 DsbA family protein [Parvibaculum sp.]MDP1626759.1 DsbA family protein [Parvibaculum sp.]MDP2213813.1 DsbA family protein [Phenylobacterium sp.]MDP3329778.1 DsbA family protein [Parvibaculum sp.]